MKYLQLTPDLAVLVSHNSFGDQLVALVDISKPTTKHEAFPYLAGSIIQIETYPEGSHISMKEASKLFAVTKTSTDIFLNNS